MKAVVLNKPGLMEDRPLEMADLPQPQLVDEEILIRVRVCGVCHTELDEIEGRLRIPKLPIVLGHQVVGEVVEKGANAGEYGIGDQVGVTWIWKSCGLCGFCKTERENLCEQAKWTGLDVNGGYAEYMKVPGAFAHRIPAGMDAVHTAPLLCAGVIGYRALRLCEIRDGQTIGLFGFGASAHLCIQVLKARYPSCKVYAFSRDREHREQARRLGADWTGHTQEQPPRKMDKAIDFTPIGEAIPLILQNLQRGGKLVINAIRKINPIPPMDYAKLLWSERTIQSTANVTRQDGARFLKVAAEIGMHPDVTEFSLDQANEALIALKQSRIVGAAVLVM